METQTHTGDNLKISKTFTIQAPTATAVFPYTEDKKSCQIAIPAE